MRMLRVVPFLLLSLFIPRASAADAPNLGGPWTIRVLVLKYFPVTPDGKTIDIKVTSNVSAPLETIRDRCDKMTRQCIEALEEGSRFRAYNNPDAKPSLRYEIVAEREYLEAMPQDPKKKDRADYRKILQREDIRQWVEEKNIKEVWIWGYHAPQLAPWESNMASRHGDISNSDRDPDDLPIFKNTYTVYHYNYQRDASLAVHDHLHQIEAMMRHYGGDLWKTFEGEPGHWRCGNCHFPPTERRTTTTPTSASWSPTSKTGGPMRWAR